MAPTILPLNGHWTLSSPDASIQPLTAPVPGSVHDALLDAHLIPDAHSAYGERDQRWVGSKTWIYARTFQADETLLQHRTAEVVCEGLDTFCTIKLNGQDIGHADNMFRHWRFNAKPALQPGNNHLELHFHPADAIMAQRSAERLLPAWNEPLHTGSWGTTGRGYVRKQSCQFGWDWGPQCPSAGPWLPIRLEARTGARIEDWRHEQVHHPDGRVTLRMYLRPDLPSDLIARGQLLLNGTTVAEIEQTFWGGWEWTLTLDHPQLWWPNGMGAQPLYTLNLTLLSPNGVELDSLTRRIGLRQIELVREPDAWGRSFFFRINGRSFFAKGANWIPLDAHPSHRNLEPRYRRDLMSAKQAHMNLLRVWGGGYFPHDVFYDLCDELGLLVWQDLMFGCGTYPVWDAAFRQSVWHETVDAATRLRHHACLACWCGNNELEQGFTASAWALPGPRGEPIGSMAWASYLDLFERILPSALTLADPTTPYIRGSPHSGPEESRDFSSERSGDLHCWEIWFSPAPFEKYRTYHHRFLSEFGFQAFPDATVLARYAPPDEVLSPDSPWLNFRQRSHPRNARIIEKTVEYFGPDSTQHFPRFCILSQITQGLALKTGMEAWRTRFPRCGGATYWQINDRWAAPTWATLDHHGNWKASHYLVRTVFAPVAIIGIEHPDNLAVDLYLVSDFPETVAGTVTLTAMRANGTLVGIHSLRAIAPELSQPASLGTFHLSHFCPLESATAQTLLWLDFRPDDSALPTASNLVLFCRPHQIGLLPACMHADFSCHQDHLIAHLRNGPSPALWVHPFAPGHLLQPEENFFHLRPHEEKTVRIPVPPDTDPSTLCRDLSFNPAI